MRRTNLPGWFAAASSRAVVRRALGDVSFFCTAPGFAPLVLGRYRVQEADRQVSGDAVLGAPT
ncbi:MAG: hypothetical protein CL908_03550 [Deltaproteobacteria bacterium]|nr:hypothetical protein [Deltaproteobacteria bacterium]